MKKFPFSQSPPTLSAAAHSLPPAQTTTLAVTTLHNISSSFPALSLYEFSRDFARILSEQGKDPHKITISSDDFEGVFDPHTSRVEIIVRPASTQSSVDKALDDFLNISKVLVHVEFSQKK